MEFASFIASRFGDVGGAVSGVVYGDVGVAVSGVV